MRGGALAVSNRQISLWLKGFAVSTVFVQHYVNLYFTFSAFGYANGIVSLFFVLSGYGIFISLDKRFQAEPPGRALAHFYWSRAKRIYPLLLLALAIDTFFLGAKFSVTDYAGITTEGIYWFVKFSIHSYIAAPVFYLFIKKTNWKIFVLLLLSGILLLNAAPHLIQFMPWKAEFLSTLRLPSYRNLWFGYLIPFGTGMALAAAPAEKYAQVLRKLVVPVCLGFFLLVHFSTIGVTENMAPVAVLVISFLFLASPVFVWAAFMYTDYRMPLAKQVVFIGVYSYVLYLLHIQFYLLLKYAGIIRKDSFVSLAATIALFVPFTFLAAAIQKIAAGQNPLRLS